MSNIAQNITRSEQTVVKTGDLVFPNSQDAFLDMAQSAGEGLMQMEYKDASKKGGEGSGSKKDFTIPMEQAIQTRKKFEAQGSSIEAQTAEMDALKVDWARQGLSPTDIDNVLKTSDLSQFSANSTYSAQKVAEEQKDNYDMLAMAARARGVAPGEGDVEAVGASVLLTSSKAKGVADALNMCSTEQQKLNLLQSNMQDMRRELHDNFNMYLADNGAKITPEVVNAYKQQRLGSMLNSGWPRANAQMFLDREMAMYDSIAKQSLTDLEGAEKWTATLANWEKDAADFKESRARNMFYNNEFEVKIGVGKNAVTKKMNGAQWSVFAKASPEAATVIFNSAPVEMINALAGSADTSRLSSPSLNWAVGPGNLSSVISGTQGETKNRAIEIRNEAARVIEETVKNTPREQLLSERTEMAVADFAIDTLGKVSVEDLKANENYWLNREQHAAKDFNDQAKAFNKLFDGEGAVIADPKTGEMRYVRATKQGTLVDATQEGWLIPWGDQDAITARDVAFAKSRQFIAAEAKLVGMDKAIELFNTANIKNSKSFREYGDFLSKATAKGRTISSTGKADRSIGAWGSDVPMSDEMATQILGYISNKDIDRAYVKEGLQSLKRGIVNTFKEADEGARELLRNNNSVQLTDEVQKAFKAVVDDLSKEKGLTADDIRIKYGISKELYDKTIGKKTSGEAPIDIRDTKPEDWVIPPATGKIEGETQVNALQLPDEYNSSYKLPDLEEYQRYYQDKVKAGEMSIEDLEHKSPAQVGEEKWIDLIANRISTASNEWYGTKKTKEDVIAAARKVAKEKNAVFTDVLRSTYNNLIRYHFMEPTEDILYAIENSGNIE